MYSEFPLNMEQSAFKKAYEKKNILYNQTLRLLLIVPVSTKN